jgi:hypothetical protein
MHVGMVDENGSDQIGGRKRRSNNGIGQNGSSKRRLQHSSISSCIIATSIANKIEGG